MSRRERYATTYSHSTSSRSWVGRGFTALLIITGITLLILSRAHNPWVGTLRAHVTDVVSPAIGWVSQPVTGVRSLLRNKKALFNAFDENIKLKEENDTLRRWQSVAQSLKAENDALRALAGYQPVSHVRYVTARVVSQSPGGYGESLTINAGAEEGVKTLQPVIDAYGLIGRTTDVGAHSSRVLLLSDSSSRVPVVSAAARMHALAAGTGADDALLKLTFVGGDASAIALGEQIVTTEEGGLIPGGIIIGTVFRRDKDGLRVKPLRPLAQSEYVRVVVTE